LVCVVWNVKIHWQISHGFSLEIWSLTCIARQTYGTTIASFHSLFHHKQFCVFVNVCVWSTLIFRIMDFLFWISSHGVRSFNSQNILLWCVVHHHFFLGSFPFALYMMGLLCLKVFLFINSLLVLSFAMPQLPNFL
jgi:hypothetical protein